MYSPVMCYKYIYICTYVDTQSNRERELKKENLTHTWTYFCLCACNNLCIEVQVKHWAFLVCVFALSCMGNLSAGGIIFVFVFVFKSWYEF